MAISKTGITTSIVGSTLGTTSRNVSTLCTHSAINKWSKYKPIEMDDAAPDRNSLWYEGDDGCCGFKQNSIIFNDISLLVQAYNNGTTYQYQPPTSYKRLADFGGYEHNAKSPCWSINVMGEIYADTSSSSVILSVDWNNGIDTNTNFTPLDLFPVTAVPVELCYFGCVILVGGRMMYKTSKNQIGDVLYPFLVELTRAEVSTVGTHQIFPAIFTVPIPTLTASGGGVKVIALPPPSSGTFQKTFTVKQSAFTNSIWWTNAWYSQAAKLTIGGTLGYKSSYEGTNVSINFYKTLNGVKDSIGNMSVTLSHTSSNGETYYMDIERTLNQATEQGVIYSISVTLSTYRVETQCDDMGMIEPMTTTITNDEE